MAERRMIRKDRRHASLLPERRLVTQQDDLTYKLKAPVNNPDNHLSTKWQPDDNQPSTIWQPTDNQTATKWQPKKDEKNSEEPEDPRPDWT